MIDVSTYSLEALREGRDFDLYRGRRADIGATILLLSPARGHHSAANVARLKHEHGLADRLDPEWALRPLALVEYEGRAMLALGDPGGMPLDVVLGAALDVGQFLPLAVALVRAIRKVHQCGLVHKDIRPANVMIDDKGHVRLTGFGLASPLRRDRQLETVSPALAGTLAYMPPEQTGRMNRSIDARSDLYSLGVTFYELLTRTLPFHAEDPLEWIHCHIARRPLPPAERVNGLPAALDGIVLKLLAKNAEDRYQTAAGLEHDLQACHSEWTRQGRMPALRLGSHDVSDRLLIPEKLYGRSAALEGLNAALQSVVSRGTTGLVLVSGYPGIGKSSTVNELQKISAPRGLFATGKFDQYKRNIPYATLAQAFQSLVHQLLVKSDAELAKWRAAIVQALGPNGQLMVNLIPELALVIGDQCPVVDLAPQEAQNRFHLVFGRFLDVFARAEHPLVLFLDDLQWLDAATLTLLERLANDQEPRYLLLVGAYRDCEVDAMHPLARTLASIRSKGRSAREIVLTPLTLEDVTNLVSEALHADPSLARPLAELVWAKTDGNPFFAIQFITSLVDDSSIIFDAVTRVWRWDLRRISAKEITNGVADLMAAKLNRLRPSTRNAIGQLACLGNVAEFSLAALIHGGSECDLHAALSEAVELGLLLQRGNAYAFLHDRVQEAAYSLIPQADRASVHLRIGRELVARIPGPELDERIFEVVNQFDRGTLLLDSPEERVRVAELDLMAGKRAMRSTAHASARAYFAAGRALLPEDCWEKLHRLTFDLEFYRAECEFLAADYPAAEARLLLLEARATSRPDAAKAVALLVALYTATAASDRGVAVGLDYLRDEGIDWPSNPSEVLVHEELDEMRRRIAGRSVEQLVNLPKMQSPELLATMKVLAEVMAPAAFTDQHLTDLVLARMANLSFQHGNSDASCFAYNALSPVLRLRLEDYETAIQLSDVGCTLIERHGLERYSARALTPYATFVVPWTASLKNSRWFARRAIDAANGAGDLTFAAYSHQSLVANLLAAGEKLDVLQRDAENARAFCVNAQLAFVADCITEKIILVRELRGLPPESEETTRGTFERRLEERGPGHLVAAAWYWVHALQGAIFADDHPAAVHAFEKATNLLPLTRRYVEEMEYCFYGALLAARTVDVSSSDERARALEELREHHRQLSVWAEKCAANFASRAVLVGAEIARVEGRELAAMRLYEDAVSSAREHGLVHIEALANELAARSYASRDYASIANTYLVQARRCYLLWGADGKVQRLAERHAHLRTSWQSSPPAAGAPGQLEQLDIATMSKAAQAISSEIVLDKLVETLMRTTIEHAGAERGVLILVRGAEPSIAAEAVTTRGKVHVTLEEKAVSSSALPESVLSYALRTRQTVILGDASNSQLHGDDAYVQRRSSRSVLCIPIVKQVELVGALYLENALTAHAFTPDRIEVLEFLASQAAISLENAYLYADLERSEEFLAEGQRMSKTGSWSWNVDSGNVFWSEEHYRIMGYEAHERPATNLRTFMDRVHPEDSARVQKALDAATREGTGFAIDFRIVLPDGSMRHLSGIGRPTVTKSGEANDYVGTTMDVSERKRAEDALRDAQADLMHVTRLTTIGEFTASIAHEISQPLAAIVTNAASCLRWLDDDRLNLDKARAAAERIERDGHRAGSIVQNIRAMLRKSLPERKPFDLNAAIGDVLDLMSGELRRNAVFLETELSNEVGLVVGDPIQVQQVLVNLVANAIDALGDVRDRPRCLRVGTAQGEDGNVLTTVADSGVGVEPSRLDHIFEPFVTTKHDGMGMGLSICRSLVEAHGGRLWASPASPHGSLFCFTLPVQSGVAPSPAVTKPAAVDTRR